MADNDVTTINVPVSSTITHENQVLAPLNNLQNSLQEMPKNIIQFSSTLRLLHAESAVSGEHEAASTFLELRDKTRKNALIYIHELLPQTEDVVRKIRAYAYEIRTFEYEDWQENVEEITEEITNAERACKFLMQLHENLIVELKKNEDAAVVGIRELDKLKKIYEEEKQKLQNAADENMKNKEWFDKMALALLLPTIGIGTYIYAIKATLQDQEMNKNILKATASGKNGEITQEAVNLTENLLIPAIQNFLSGLAACNNFLISTREELEEISSKGRKGLEDKKKRYYNLMKNHANDLDSNCMFFLTSTTQIRTNLKAIPAEPSDKNYVDKWLSNQLAQFEEKHPEINVFGSVQKFFKSQTEKFSST